MTDLEICKRIAWIDNQIELCSNAPTIKDTLSHCHEENELGYNLQYNPLTDDALCFKLMIKYKLSLIAPEGEQTEWDCVIRDVLTVDENPNKAICLAIIEANQ